MLIEEGGDLKMRVLAEGAETNLAVKTICSSIMEVLENETAPCPMQVENVWELLNIHFQRLILVIFQVEEVQVVNMSEWD